VRSGTRISSTSCRLSFLISRERLRSRERLGIWIFRTVTRWTKWISVNDHSGLAIHRGERTVGQRADPATFQQAKRRPEFRGGIRIEFAEELTTDTRHDLTSRVETDLHRRGGTVGGGGSGVVDKHCALRA